MQYYLEEPHQKVKQALMFINFRIQLSPCATALFRELILRYLSAMPPGTLQKSHTPGYRLSFQRCHLFCLPCICKNFSFDYITTQLAWRGQLNKWFKTGLCNCSVLLTLSEWWICVLHWVLLSAVFLVEMLKSIIPITDCHSSSLEPNNYF